MLPFVGPSYTLSTRKASAQRSVNLYLSGMETPSKNAFILERMPGLVPFSTIIAAPRGCIEAQGRAFVVAGQSLFEIDHNGVATVRGTLSTNTGPVGMAFGVTQLVIVDGLNGYILTLSSNVFAPITDPDFPGSRTVGYLNGFFTLVTPNAQQAYVTAIDDAGNIDALDFVSAERSPDPIVGQVCAFGEWWMIGEYTTEIWQPSGALDFPFSRNEGANMEVGAVAAFSIKSVDNSVIFVGRDRNGAGLVYRFQGYQPMRISTQAVEEELAKSSDLSEAVAFTFQKRGKTFYCLNAPGLTSTWCYELASGTWFEACDLDGNGQFTQWRGQYHMFCFGENLVCGSDGVVYRMDHAVNTYGSDPIVCERISPHEALPTLDRQFFKEFVLDSEFGVAPLGVTPLVELSWSNDGGFAFSNPIQVSLGLTGQRYARATWNRLGYARDRVWKVRFSDNAPFAILSGVAR